MPVKVTNLRLLQNNLEPLPRIQQGTGCLVLALSREHEFSRLGCIQICEQSQDRFIHRDFPALAVLSRGQEQFPTLEVYAVPREAELLRHSHPGIRSEERR